MTTAAIADTGTVPAVAICCNVCACLNIAQHTPLTLAALLAGAHQESLAAQVRVQHLQLLLY
jgi:hypothetical protein